MAGPSTAGIHVAPIVINGTTGHLQGSHTPVLYGHMAWWVGGFICTLLSCIGSASGNVLKRLSRSPSRTDGTADAAKGHQGSQSCSAMWVAGLFLMTLPLPLDCVALALADASLIIPLSDSLTLVLNHVLIPWLLGQKLGIVDAYVKGRGWGGIGRRGYIDQTMCMR